MSDVLALPVTTLQGEHTGLRAVIGRKAAHAAFCSATYGVTFPMSEIAVNGPNRDPLNALLRQSPIWGR
jgi:glutathione peroxidase-family protein